MNRFRRLLALMPAAKPRLGTQLVGQHVKVDQGGERRNNFGSLRLLFAALVILSHSPELIDGNRHRELLTRLFGTISFGEAGIDGFFVISGYLVTKSFVARRSTLSYLRKRVLRIVPGYLANYLICLLLVAPLAGAPSVAWKLPTIGQHLWAMLHLDGPGVAGAFPGLHQPALNGSAWSIAYEFRCYVLTVIFGFAGAYGKWGRIVLVAAVAICLGITAESALQGLHWHREAEFGRAEYVVRLCGIYGVGCLFFLYRHAIVLRHRTALLAACVLAACMFSKHTAQPAWAVLGGYLIFWFAYRVPVLKLSLLDNRIDVSYGLYLYAWPVQNLLIYNGHVTNPWVLATLALPLTALVGWLSWVIIERPALRLDARRLVAGTAIPTPPPPEAAATRP